jgi:hypothetical protein
VRKLKERFEALTVNLEDITVIILNCDRTVWRRVVDGAWSFPFATQLSCTEKLNLGVEEQDLIPLLELLLLDPVIMPSLSSLFIELGTVISFLTLFL